MKHEVPFLCGLVRPRIPCIIMNACTLVFLTCLIYALSKLLTFHPDVSIYIDEFQDHAQNQFNQGKVDETYLNQIQSAIACVKIGFPLVIITGLILIIMKFVFTVLLLAAAFLNRHLLCLPWMVFNGISLCLKAVAFVSLVVIIAVFVNSVAFVIFGLLGGSFLGVAFFYWYVVWSCYRSLKAMDSRNSLIKLL